MEKFVNFSGARVLLAHSNRTTARLYESVLRSFGVRLIEVAGDAREAAQKLQLGRIDLALLDQSIGSHAVYEMVTRVRRGQTETAKEIPILLTYGHSRQRDVLSFRDCGASLVMTLPFSIQGLYERLSWLAQKPKPFVTALGYCGPCRRNIDDPLLARQGRRASDRQRQRTG